MSTKIFNGYKIEGSLSAYEMMNLLNSLSEDCTEICKSIYNKEVSKLASMYLDTKIIFGEEAANKSILTEYEYKPSFNGSTLYSCVRDLIEKHSKSHSIFQCDFDFKCDVKLFPLHNKILFLLYAEKKEYLSLFGGEGEKVEEDLSCKYSIISPYIYYNNTDKPETLTEEEWDLRRREWDEALKNDENGLKFSLAKVPYIFNMDLVLKDIENRYEDRIYVLSKEKLNKSFFYDNNDRLKDMSIGEQVEFYNNYIKSEDYIKKLKNVKIEIENNLPKSYTRDDLKSIKIFNK